MQRFKGKNLVDRKKAEKNLNEIKNVNHQFYEYLEAFSEGYEGVLSSSDSETFKNLQQHLLNLNFIFSKMVDSK